MWQGSAPHKRKKKMARERCGPFFFASRQMRRTSIVTGYPPAENLHYLPCRDDRLVLIVPTLSFGAFVLFSALSIRSMHSRSPQTARSVGYARSVRFAQPAR